MTPDSPGLWRCRYTDGREVVYRVIDTESGLWVVAEEGGRALYGASSSVKQFTELLDSMGWGKWAARVGDLPGSSASGPSATS